MKFSLAVKVFHENKSGTYEYKGCEERAEEKRSGTTMANGALGAGDDYHF
ncbi:hypothetical protein B1no1_09560 [Thermolongibacillus altinsuensis]|nr:hypothetical protein B1no1_09560 [Thermolongibacillus altinsuensis]